MPKINCDGGKSGSTEMTIIEYAQYLHRDDLVAKLESAWGILEQRYEPRNIMKDGAPLYAKSFKSNLSYSQRAPDTISKMLGIVKPCAATYIDLQKNENSYLIQ